MVRSFLIGLIAIIGLPIVDPGDSYSFWIEGEREDVEDATSVSKVVFGSCIKQEHPVPILKPMAAERADLILFTGDNIYADTEDMAVMRAKYERLGKMPGFEDLVKPTDVLATWDDHDFGVNDGGADYPKRLESQKEFLDFWGVPADSPRRQQQGVYDQRRFGPRGKCLQVIMLDTRYFRSPLKVGEKRTGGKYIPDSDTNKTMLGETQWKWLERQLRKPADVRLIVSSIQFVASDAGQECWANLPRERQRLIDLIKTTDAQRVVFVSGDRHWSEISSTGQETEYPLYDITCSSLNQLHGRGTPTANRYRVGKNTFHRENYGVFSINWDTPSPTVSVEIRDIDGATVIRKSLSGR